MNIRLWTWAYVLCWFISLSPFHHGMAWRGMALRGEAWLRLVVVVDERCYPCREGLRVIIPSDGIEWGLLVRLVLGKGQNEEEDGEEEGESLRYIHTRKESLPQSLSLLLPIAVCLFVCLLFFFFFFFFLPLASRIASSLFVVGGLWKENEWEESWKRRASKRQIAKPKICCVFVATLSVRPSLSLTVSDGWMDGIVVIIIITATTTREERDGKVSLLSDPLSTILLFFLILTAFVVVGSLK